jgi:hypothetical protein
MELGASRSVGAGHNAQHGHVLSLTSAAESQLPEAPTLIAAHDPAREKESKWTRSDLLVNETLTQIFKTETCQDAEGNTVRTGKNKTKQNKKSMFECTQRATCLTVDLPLSFLSGVDLSHIVLCVFVFGCD